MIRNPIYLSLHSECLTLPMRLQLFVKAILRMFIFLLWSKNDKTEYFKAAFLGFFHGLKAQLGTYPNE